MATTKVPNNFIDLSGDSGAVPWAAGTTAQRPGSPNAGDFRYNTDDTLFEFYNGSEWRQITSFNPYSIQFLVIAGGGGGEGGSYGAGGGAGGYRTSYGDASVSALDFSSGTVYTITVGAGGGTGTASSVAGSDITSISSAGGGAGGGVSGGSGGGAKSGSAGSGNVPSVTPAQGFDGSVNGSLGGAGGGASEAGGAKVTRRGGDGLQNSITGTATYYAGGGGGGANTGPNFNQPRGQGGLGGGGESGTNTGNTANTGGGGGGGNWTGNTSISEQSGKAGASGVVILRMLTAIYSGTTTGSPTVTTDSSDTILTYTGSGTYTH